MPIYLAAEVGHAWLIDPELRTLEVFTREGKRWALVATHRDDAVVRAAPFEELALDLGGLWRRPLGA
jgi:hypothetical protein